MLGGLDALGAAVLRKSNVSVTVHRFVKAALGGTSCPNWTGSLTGEVGAVYDYYGKSDGNYADWLVNWATFKSRLDANRLLQIRYGYKSTSLTTGHIVTAYGYSGTNTVKWVNPAGRSQVAATWGYLSDNATWRSTATLYNMGV